MKWDKPSGRTPVYTYHCLCGCYIQWDEDGQSEFWTVCTKHAFSKRRRDKVFDVAHKRYCEVIDRRRKESE